MISVAAFFLISHVTAEAALQLRVEPGTVRVAEPLTLTLVSETPGVTWPDWAEALPEWDVVPQNVTDHTATLTLRSWLPGDITVPAVAVTTPGGVTFTSEPRVVAVNSVLPEDADVADAATLREAAGALPLPDDGTPWPVVVAGIVTGLWVVGGAAWLLRRIAGSRAGDPETQVDRMVSEAVQHRDVALASAAVRRSVEQQFGIDASQQTTEDLKRDPRLLGTLGGPLHDRLVELLQRIDAIRYAEAADDRWAAAADAGELIRDLREVAAREPGKGDRA